MCGIAGYSGRFELSSLQRMADAISHRGPDDAGLWHSADRSVGLAHRRLSIIDLSPLGHQPMTDAPGTAVVVFNGEIYNFREIRAEMEARGIRFKGNSDTEVLLAAYRAMGEAMLWRLNGIFAFAIFDHIEQTLFLACDSMGVKPLYFSEGAECFVFASELKALLACREVPRVVDVQALMRYLGFLWSPGGSTPLAAVKRLGPGDAMLVREGCVIRRWHWAPSAWESKRISDATSTIIEQVREGLRTAVHRQLVADVPIGAFLSGGLDSSAVVAMAREISPGIDCFTIDSGPQGDEGVADDLPYARRVARHLGVRLHEIKIDSSRMASDLERMVFQLDEPLADPAPLNVLYISELARQHGVKVLLSGAGGDDLFSGYRRHRALAFERYWAWLPESVRRALTSVTSSSGIPGTTGRRLAKAFSHADQAPDQRLVGYFEWADSERIRALFKAEHRHALAGFAMTEPLDSFLRLLPLDLEPLNKMLALEQRFFLPDHNLLYTDKMSMAAGVEVRVPFLDNDLVRLANALPTDLKQRRDEEKWVLKKAMEAILPRDVIYRPKTGFGAPLRRWLRHELKDWVDDILSADSIRARGLFDPTSVAALVAEDRAGRIDAAYSILGLVCVEVWFRRFL